MFRKNDLHMNAKSRSAKQYKAQRLGLQYAWTNPRWNGNILEKICFIYSAREIKEINEKIYQKGIDKYGKYGVNLIKKIRSKKKCLQKEKKIIFMIILQRLRNGKKLIKNTVITESPRMQKLRGRNWKDPNFKLLNGGGDLGFYDCYYSLFDNVVCCLKQ